MEKMSGKLKAFRSNMPTFGATTSGTKNEIDVKENLTPENFLYSEIVRHGFPFQPTCLAFDPVQKLLAIGTQSGAVRILGRPLVDFYLKHESRACVLKIHFLINEGAFITLCSDDCIHLWNYRQRRPDIVHSLKFQKEKLTTMHLPFQSKWLYLGTERGNVHVVGVESFSLSGYVINWNKAIDLSQRSHPGPIVHLSDCPTDESKLLIGYERGTIVLWDLKLRQAEGRYQCEHILRSISWHFEGKQFVCGHANGCLTTWAVKRCQEPLQTVFPHARGHSAAAKNQTSQTPDTGGGGSGSEQQPPPPKSTSMKEKFRPISTVDWKYQKGGDDFVIFSGGMPTDDGAAATTSVSQPCVTVLRGKSVAVLEMQHSIVTFLTLCESPYSHDAQDPYAIVVLLQNDLVVVDLTTQGYPCFENPNPMDIHESPVTSCAYLVDCSTDVISSFYSVGSKQKRQGYTDKPWPIKGGDVGACTFSYPELVITGHADGSLKFWDASSVNLQVLYKLKTSKLFDKPDTNAPADLDLFAIEHITYDADSRLLAVAGEAGHVVLLRFCRTETTCEIPTVEVLIAYSHADENDSAVDTSTTGTRNGAGGQKRPELKSQHSVGSLGSNFSLNSESDKSTFLPVKAKGGPQKRPAGYQPELICLTVWSSVSCPEAVTALALNSAYGLMAYGTEKGLAVVDFLQQICILSMATPDLYGGSDPYNRSPRPNNVLEKNPSSDPENFNSPSDKSENNKEDASVEQVEEEASKSIVFEKCPSVQRKDDEEAVSSPVDEVNMYENIGVGAKVVEAAKEKSRAATIKDFLRKTSTNERRMTREMLKRQDSAPEALRRPGLTAAAPLSPPATYNADCGRGKPRKSASERKHLQVDTGSIMNRGDGQAKKKQSLGVCSSPNLIHIGKTTATILTATLVPPTTNAAQQRSSMSAENIALTPGSGSEHVHSPTLKNKRVSFGVKKKISVADEHTCEYYYTQWPQTSVDQQTQLTAANSIGPAEDGWGLRTLVRRISSKRHNDKENFERSRSSSSSSQENLLAMESIRCLTFVDMQWKKNETFSGPTLWVGTSQGTALAMNLRISLETRLEQAVAALPTGIMFRANSSVLCIGFMDQNGCSLLPPSESWKDASKAKERVLKNRVLSKPKMGAVSPTNGAGSAVASANALTDTLGGGGSETNNAHLILVCTEKTIKVYSLYSTHKLYSTNVDQQLVHAAVVTVDASPIVACYTKNGRVLAFSLPSLKALFDVSLTTSNDLRISRTMQFSYRGHGLYMCSPSEIQKFTFSREIAAQLQDVVGVLFQACNMPEPPKQNFLKELFGGATSKSLDREELFGESSGKTSKSVARHIPGSGNLEALRGKTGGTMNEVQKAAMALNERGDKLSEVEERTAQMMENSKSYADHASELLNKYKKQKWYKF